MDKKYRDLNNDSNKKSKELRMAIISDIHSNANALEAVLADIVVMDCHEVINLGDAIAIGPDPERVMGILVARRIASVLGNHEQYFLEGTKAFPKMEPGERAHQDWVKAQLGEPFIPVMSELPLQIIQYTDGLELSFLHYAFAQNDQGMERFSSVLKPQTPEGLAALFTVKGPGITFFGHSHESCDLVDPITKHRFINPGALGCSSDNLARYCIVTFNDGQVTTEFREVPYNKQQVMDRLFSRAVPEREVLVKAFYS